MGDYTAFTLTTHRVTPDKNPEFQAAVEAVLGGPTIVGKTDEYCDVRCGTVTDLAEELVTIDPDSIFEMWEDPKYEWLGTIALYHPEPGLFLGECDAEGNVVVFHEAIAETGILLSPEADEWTMSGLLEAQDKLATLFGRYQIHAIADSTRGAAPSGS